MCRAFYPEFGGAMGGTGCPRPPVKMLHGGAGQILSIGPLCVGAGVVHAGAEQILSIGLVCALWWWVGGGGGGWWGRSCP